MMKQLKIATIRNLAVSRTLLTMAMVLILPALIVCQSEKGSDEKAVRQTISELAAALSKNDSAVLDRIYADDYMFVGDTGTILTKAERMAAFKSGDLKYESITIDVVSLKLFGNTAVAITRIVSNFAPGTKYTSGRFVTTATFVKIKGRWQLVAAGNTRSA